MTSPKKQKGAASVAADPRHVIPNPTKEMRMNAHTHITSGAVPATEVVATLIEAHINAVAEHNRLFNLADWKIIPQSEPQAALLRIDETLIALCAQHPATPAEAKLRFDYLMTDDRLQNATALDVDLLYSVFEALLQPETPGAAA